MHIALHPLPSVAIFCTLGHWPDLIGGAVLGSCSYDGPRGHSSGTDLCLLQEFQALAYMKNYILKVSINNQPVERPGLVVTLFTPVFFFFFSGCFLNVSFCIGTYVSLSASLRYRYSLLNTN